MSVGCSPFFQLLEAMNGKDGVIECAFVKSDVTEAAYFANPILLGKDGMAKNLGMGTLSDFEKKKLQEVKLIIIMGSEKKLPIFRHYRS